MAPEQARGEKIDASPDLWSVGVVLFELITGKRFLPSGPAPHILNVLLNEEPNLQPLQTVAPEDVVQVVQRCLQKRKSPRYRSASELLNDLRGCRSNAAGSLTSSETFWLPSGSLGAVETEDHKPPSSVLLLPEEAFEAESGSPFVQRASELERMDRTLDLALNGRGQLLFIQGETGQRPTDHVGDQ